MIIDPTNDHRWDEFVAHHPFGWICHLSGWGQALERSFKHIKGHYLAVLDEKGTRIRSALPLFEVRSWLTGDRLVSVPFATLCDPLVSSSEDFETLMDAALELAGTLKISRIQIRSRAADALIQDKRLSSTRFYQHHYLSLEPEPDKLLKTFNRTCIRQKITRANKSNLSLRRAEAKSELFEFYRVFCMTQKRLGLPPLPYAFFLALWDAFGQTGNIVVFLAEKDGQAIAGIVLFMFRDRASLEMAAWDEAYQSVCPNHYLYWEAIKYARENGCSIFDFGRTSPNNHGLMKFKKHWGTQVVALTEYPYPARTGGKIVNPDESMRYRIVRALCQRAPERAYERLGQFCYRHLG
jgi:FemAB-related protein (PEP-CTERM system-associated)